MKRGITVLNAMVLVIAVVSVSLIVNLIGGILTEDISGEIIGNETTNVIGSQANVTLEIEKITQSPQIITQPSENVTEPVANITGPSLIVKNVTLPQANVTQQSEDVNLPIPNITKSFINLTTVVSSNITESNLTGSPILSPNLTSSSLNVSEVKNSVLNNSTVVYSNITYSLIKNSTIMNSTIMNLTVNNANITNGIIYSGNLSFGNITYNADAHGAIEIESILSCEGCFEGRNCLSYGIRESGKYCDLTKQFLLQKNLSVDCENNYECETNLCINNQCMSKGLLQKIMHFLTKVFGG